MVDKKVHAKIAKTKSAKAAKDFHEGTQRKNAPPTLAQTPHCVRDWSGKPGARNERGLGTESPTRRGTPKIQLKMKNEE
jgi:hypothetical protein